MPPATFRFTLGHFECVAINDGNFNYPLEVFFTNAPRAKVEDSLGRHGLPADRVTTPFTCLYVNTGQHRVLIDLGAGRLAASAATLFPGIDHSTTATGTLRANMETVGLRPADVDTLIVTHAHPDHVGGALDEAGQLVFAAAQYYLHTDEWTFWTSAAAEAKAWAPLVQVARRNLAPMRDRLTLVEAGNEIVPGIRAVPTSGHTPGHMALLIESAGERLLHISDAALHPLHLEHPAWYPAFDLEPDQAVASKRRIFDQAAAEGLLVFGHHFPPAHGLGRVTREGDGWRWRPLEA